MIGLVDFEPAVPCLWLIENFVKYKGSVFKIPLPFHWHVIVSGPKLIEELRKAEEDELSFGEAVAAVSELITISP